MSALGKLLPLTQAPSELATSLPEAITLQIEQIDDALMKRGTLSIEDIDWRNIETISSAVLQDCVHLTAVRGLVYALNMRANDIDPRDVVDFMIRLMSYYWPNIHPAGPKRKRLRDTWLLEVLNTVSTLIETHVEGHFDDTPSLGEKVSTLNAAIKQHDITHDPLRKLETTLKTAKKPPARPAQAASNEPSGTPRKLDAKGRAELRRDIISLADRIGQNEPDAEIAFSMRRYAAWLDFRVLPPSNAEGKIEQNPLPSQITREFEASAEAPTTGVLRKLEDRLSTSPDWFAGHRLAAGMAEKLDRPGVADAIRMAIARRLEAFPELRNLRFANGDPLVTEDILKWAIPISAPPTNAAPPEDVPADEEPSPADLKAQLQALNIQNPVGRSLRANAIAKLKIAETFQSEGLISQANLLLEDLHAIFEDLKLRAWDSELAAEVDRMLKQ